MAVAESQRREIEQRKGRRTGVRASGKTNSLPG